MIGKEFFTHLNVNKQGESAGHFGNRENLFFILIAFLFVVAGLVYSIPGVAMWVGFFVASYSVVANDSLQTIGTFINSNEDKKWWVMWLFIGAIFLVIIFYSWYSFNGDVSFQRLSSKGFSESPSQYSFMQIAAPIVLLILTRLKMPVSTTFMLLGVFTTNVEGVLNVVTKSFLGYVIAFLTAFIVWFLLNKTFENFTKKVAKPFWIVLQWGISGVLWGMWIAHDAANVAIFLPRQLSLIQFIIFAASIFLGLGFLFYKRGAKMQEIVSEKTDLSDVRSATVVDLVYAFILLLFINVSTIPMSTTWVFIGLLGGRELAKAISKSSVKQNNERVLKAVLKDLMLAGLGFVISIILALLSNKELVSQFINLF